MRHRGKVADGLGPAELEYVACRTRPSYGVERCLIVHESSGLLTHTGRLVQGTIGYGLPVAAKHGPGTGVTMRTPFYIAV